MIAPQIQLNIIPANWLSKSKVYFIYKEIHDYVRARVDPDVGPTSYTT